MLPKINYEHFMRTFINRYLRFGLYTAVLVTKSVNKVNQVFDHLKLTNCKLLFTSLTQTSFTHTQKKSYIIISPVTVCDLGSMRGPLTTYWERNWRGVRSRVSLSSGQSTADLQREGFALVMNTWPLIPSGGTSTLSWLQSRMPSAERCWVIIPLTACIFMASNLLLCAN